MTYRDDFESDVRTFMRTHTLYLPGGGIGDGGKIDFTDPAYAVYANNANVIRVPARPVAAAWRHGVRPGHVKLLLKVSRDYKMLGTGRTERAVGLGANGTQPIEGLFDMGKAGLVAKATNAGASPAKARQYAKRDMQLYDWRVDDAEWFWCYFLPWADGRKVSMTLGDRARYFFTATMNGCMFHVTGSPDAPRVSHLNTGLPGDTLAPPSKATIKARYAAMLGTGTHDDAVVSKYKAAAGFLGRNARYKGAQAEFDALADPDIIPESKSAGDMNTLVVGVRDDTDGWEFFYQRNAMVQTNNVGKTQKQMGQDMKYVPKNAFASAKKVLGMDHGLKLKPYLETVYAPMTIGHTVTPCVRVPYN